MQSVLAPLVGPKVCVPPSLSGRVAIVTGGALGIGYEVSRAFAKAGAKVIMVNRKEEQGDEAIAKIKKETPEAKIEWVGCDLGTLSEVKEVFSGLAKKEERLDLLILSAGINSNQYGLDNDGIDRHFGVNWLGHFLAINQLYPLLRKTSRSPGAPAPRIVFEASEMHRFCPSNMHFGSLEEINNDQLTPIELYGRTKAAMILGSKYGIFEKVIKKNKDNVYTLTVHPGAVNTDMQAQWKDAYPGLTGKVAEAFALFTGRDVEQGSYSAIYAATSEDIIKNNWNGSYFTDPETLGKETAQCSDPALGAALWELSTRLVEEKLGKEGLISWDA
ncbi:putative short-chain dehydrogenase TIC 32, chloroplastic [Mrakia frigida]|uniref:putative short-chain dehydrogenase TIC 32, chloroplastic n=1 Tax=Mrakia frigida TaxID=29902 RepID=UPI003FCC164C